MNKQSNKKSEELKDILESENKDLSMVGFILEYLILNPKSVDEIIVILRAIGLDKEVIADTDSVSIDEKEEALENQFIGKKKHSDCIENPFREFMIKLQELKSNHLELKI